MKLYLMRHGAAEERAESNVDGDRALTAAGRQRVRRVAMTLLEAGEEPLRLLTSPLVRAVQTAEIVALTTHFADGGGKVETRSAIAPAGDLVALARHLATEGHKRVMLVGHEPDLSALFAALVSALDRPFEKAMVVGVHVNAGGNGGRLRFVLDPKMLRFDPDRRRDS